MNVGLIDVDGHGFPNIALMKAATYHRSIGDSVSIANIGHYDVAYASKLFKFSQDIDGLMITADETFKGGSGYDLKTMLPDYIDSCQPDYSIYPYDFSVQFYSRGCIRHCPFCIVHDKEGYIHSVDPMNLNPKGKHIEVLDNNFFAAQNWLESVKHLIQQKQKVNLHGVDVRIINEEQSYWLNQLKHIKQIHIAWDNPKDNIITKIKEMIKYVKPYKIMCYVLIGYWSNEDQDLYRVEQLRALGIDPFVMPFNKSDHYQKRFARWVNHKAIFKKVKWSEYNK